MIGGGEGVSAHSAVGTRHIVTPGDPQGCRRHNPGKRNPTTLKCRRYDPCLKGCNCDSSHQHLSKVQYPNRYEPCLRHSHLLLLCLPPGLHPRLRNDPCLTAFNQGSAISFPVTGYSVALITTLSPHLPITPSQNSPTQNSPPKHFPLE